jgi:hypothetical protein
MYVVTIKTIDGSEHISRIFSTIRAARRWTRWLETRDYVVFAQISRR